MLQGVVLDVDGTLVLSNDAHAQSWVDAFATFGYEDVTFDQVRSLIGMGGDKLMPTVVPGLEEDSPQGKSIAEYRQKLFLNEFVSQLKPTPGARDLVLKLHQAQLKLMVASSAKPQQLGSLLKAAQVKDLLPETTSSGEVEASKPDPDIVQVALSKMQMQPDQVIMLGDTPYDIESAGKTGVKVIAFRTGGFSDEQLAGAIAIYNDPADLLEHYDQSPLAS